MQKFLYEREEMNRQYNTPEHRKLRYAAAAVMAVAVALLLSTMIWIDSLPQKVMLIMRGCAGLGALAFVVIVGVLTYRANCQHISNRHN